MRDILQLPGIKPLNVDVHEGRIFVHAVPVAKSARPACPNCGKLMVRHGAREHSFADIPLQNQPVILVLKIARNRCEDCKKTQNQEVRGLDERRRATRRLVDYVRQQCLTKPFNRLAEETGLAVNTIKNIAEDFVNELDRNVKYATPVHLGIAELSIAEGKHLAFFNLATETIIEVLPRCGWAAAKRYFKNMPERNRVEWVCVGSTMNLAGELNQYFPNAAMAGGRRSVSGKNAEGLEERLTNVLATLSDGTQVAAERLRRWYSFEILRAKILYTAQAREAVRVDLLAKGTLSASVAAKPADYGAHVPTLIKITTRTTID